MPSIVCLVLVLLWSSGTAASAPASPGRLPIPHESLAVVWSVQRTLLPLASGQLEETHGLLRVTVPLGERLTAAGEIAVLQNDWVVDAAPGDRQISGIPTVQLTYHYRLEPAGRRSVGVSANTQGLQVRHQFRSVHDPLLFTSEAVLRITDWQGCKAPSRWSWSGQVLFAANTQWGLGMGLQWSQGRPAIQPTIVWNLGTAQITGSAGFSPMDNSAILGLSLQLRSPSP